MLIHLLGALQVHGEHQIELAPRARSLLAAMALHPGEPVSNATLSEWLWDEDRYPINPSSALYTYISRLRTSLRGCPLSISTLSNAYVLEVDPAVIDVHLFEQQLRSDRRVQQADEDNLRSALAIWRGPALCDIPPTEPVLAERSRLDELRLQVLEARYELLISSGRAAESVSDLYKLVRENPYRERLVSQLMACLAQLGRRAEALHLFHGIGRRFREELGVELSASLRDLHMTLLRDAAPSAPSRKAQGSDGVIKPSGHGDGKPTLTIISGPPGSGTTTVALRHARLHQHKYPDGVQFLELSDQTATQVSVLTGAGLTISVDPACPEPRNGPRTLTILDGCGSLRQLRAWLARLDGHVLVSSSRRFHEVTGAQHIHLGVPPVSQAVAMLADMLPAGPSATSDQLKKLTALCDCNLVALSATAANLHNLAYPSVPTAIAALSVPPAERVTELTCGELSVYRSFGRALTHLSADEWQLLGELAASYTGWLPIRDVADHIGMPGQALRPTFRGLVEANLLMARMTADGTAQFRLSPLCAGTAQLLGNCGTGKAARAVGPALSGRSSVG